MLSVALLEMLWKPFLQWINNCIGWTRFWSNIWRLFHNRRQFSATNSDIWILPLLCLLYLLVYNVFLMLIDIFMVIYNFKPSVICKKESNPNYALKVVIRAFQRGCARNREPFGWNGSNANGPIGTECLSCLHAPRIERKKMRQPASSLAMWILSLGKRLSEPVSLYLRNEPMMNFFGLRPKYWRL